MQDGARRVFEVFAPVILGSEFVAVEKIEMLVQSVFPDDILKVSKLMKAITVCKY